ncbi:hypothetical protein [Nitrosococcus wardiae]|uniref:Uncharacterized protein n=1 Tax=Nitrosococcus wardiae TaxID=1814290 RepID=A0A4P7BZU5_9GAMM|nr:hypothetical protein [Nitrosococcus wardiae]QBQ55773.1 hypothetical protein E3U44_15565 [Nitrosococcus wardiae]
MTIWYSKDVGDGVAALGPSTAIQRAFLRVVDQGRFTTDMAVFSRYDLSRNVVTLYFTPSASALAVKFGATPSEKPIPDSRFARLVGDQKSWDIHFPNYEPGSRQ